MALVSLSRSDGSVCSSTDSESKCEDFFTTKTIAFRLNYQVRHPCSNDHANYNIQNHLCQLLRILRYEDSLKMCTALETSYPRLNYSRYFCLVAPSDKETVCEAIILGVDVEPDRVTIGLVEEVRPDMRITLDGDSGFKIFSHFTERLFKPKSVQGLWQAFHYINDYRSSASTLPFTDNWPEHYKTLKESASHQIQEWHQMSDVEDYCRASPPTLLPKDATPEEKEEMQVHDAIVQSLRVILEQVDLEEVTMLQIRERLEESLHSELRKYRHFIENQVLKLYGQMDRATEILPHLLLGSSFNASNHDEIVQRNVTHILNITREVDNFFPAEGITYMNIRVFDNEDTDLRRFWMDTFSFIELAREKGTRCLVHCKMGVSRSASTVIAYVMKRYGMSLEKAHKFVSEKRPCIRPNVGFMKQLGLYQSMLVASRNRFSGHFTAASLKTILDDPPSVAEGEDPTTAEKE